MSWMAPPPEPKSLLGRHRLLSPSAGIRVSPLCIGGMSFGDAWAGMLGAVSRNEVSDLLDYFYEQGGNFIDTSNNYQDEQSERWIGDWIRRKTYENPGTQRPGFRDQLVIATKFTTNYQSYKAKDDPNQQYQSAFLGNNAKSLRLSVEASLKKLQTEYIDLLYVHWWDFTTSIPELMQSLNTIVEQGKVLYLGVSDTPAWIVSKANEYARNHGLRQFVVYQGKWSAADRDFERDIIPMSASEGMGLAPWGALGGGNFKTHEQREQTKGEGRQMGGPSENQMLVADALAKMAEKKKTALVSVALAYVMHKAPYVFPIVGGRKIDHLKGNIEALSLKLSKEDIEEIEDAAPFDVGFPLNFLGMGIKGGAKGPNDVFLTRSVGHFDYVEGGMPIRPKKKE